MNSSSKDLIEKKSYEIQPYTKPRCLIGVSGSVAAVKIPELVSELVKYFDVMLVCTDKSMFFLERAEVYNQIHWRSFELAGGWSLIFQDKDEWDMWNRIGNSVLHIELRKWADIFLVAPGSADIISKASCGVCDNLLLSVMRAWDFNKPCILCPAMNTFMWNHPITDININILKSWGWKILGPIEKTLACLDKGNGALVEVREIIDYLRSLRLQKNDSNMKIESNESQQITLLPLIKSSRDHLINSSSQPNPVNNNINNIYEYPHENNSSKKDAPISYISMVSSNILIGVGIGFGLGISVSLFFTLGQYLPIPFEFRYDEVKFKPRDLKI